MKTDTSLALGDQEQLRDGFQKSMGLTRLCPSHDALPMCADHLGDILHRRDLGAHHASLQYLAATAQWGAVLLRPGQSLRWPELARESCFVIPLCGDDPVAAAAGH